MTEEIQLTQEQTQEQIQEKSLQPSQQEISIRIFEKKHQIRKNKVKTEQLKADIERAEQQLIIIQQQVQRKEEQKANQEEQKANQEEQKVNIKSDYDLEIKIMQNLLDLGKGILTKLKRHSGEQWHKFLTEPALLVGILGQFKAGKTWFLSKLNNKDFGHSYTNSTRGINVIFGGSQYDSNIYYIDTAGYGEPLCAFDGLWLDIEIEARYQGLMLVVYQDGYDIDIKTNYKVKVIYQQMGIEMPLYENKKLEIDKYDNYNNQEEDRPNIEYKVKYEDWKILLQLEQEGKIAVYEDDSKNEDRFQSDFIYEIIRKGYYILKDERQLDEKKSERQTDISISERFIQNFVIDKCPVIIVMISHFNNTQEKLINFLSSQTKAENNRHKKVICIHNFKKIFLQDQMMQMIQKQIINNFRVNIQKICRKINGVDVNAEIYIDKTLDETNPIIHLAMINEKADELLRRQYNDFAFDVVQIEIQAQRAFERVDFFTIMKKYVNENIEKYIKIEYSQEDLDHFDQLNKQKDEGGIVQANLEADFKKTDNGYVLVSDILDRCIKAEKFRKLKIENFNMRSILLYKTIFDKQVFSNYNVIKTNTHIVVVLDLCGITEEYFLNKIEQYKCKNCEIIHPNKSSNFFFKETLNLTCESEKCQKTKQSHILIKPVLNFKIIKNNILKKRILLVEGIRQKPPCMLRGIHVGGEGIKEGEINQKIILCDTDQSVDSKLTKKIVHNQGDSIVDDNQNNKITYCLGHFPNTDGSNDINAPLSKSGGGVFIIQIRITDEDDDDQQEEESKTQ